MARLAVVMYADTTKNKKMISIGSASINKDVSINGFYDIFPKDLTFQIRVVKNDKAAAGDEEVSEF